MVVVVVIGELVAPCLPRRPNSQSLLEEGPELLPVAKSKGLHGAELGKERLLMPSAFGGVWGSEEQWSLCPQPPGIWPRSQAWVWLGSHRQVLFEVTLSKLSLNPWVERQLGAGCKDDGSASQGWKQRQCLWAAGWQEVCGLEECGQAGGTCGRTQTRGLGLQVGGQ